VVAVAAEAQEAPAVEVGAEREGPRWAC
jgi:hypothetical protein